MRPVPDLFSRFNNRHEIEQYCSVYLVQLLRANRTRRVIEACRCIRRFAKNHGRPKAALFTFQFEIDAYERRKPNASAMWRVLRSWDRMALGKPILDDAMDAARYGLYSWVTASDKPLELEIREKLQGLDMQSAYVRSLQMKAEVEFQNSPRHVSRRELWLRRALWR